MAQNRLKWTPACADVATLRASTCASPRKDLAAREREVARLLVAGRTDRQIASGLVISRKTAANHVASVLTKLGVVTRTAVATCLLRGAPAQ
jgi:DNA-binding NarL/FixJ family response regulator